MGLSLFYKDTADGALKILFPSCKIIGAKHTLNILNNDLEIIPSLFEINAIVNQDNLNFLFRLNEKLEVMVLNDEYFIFNGYLISDFSSDFKDPIEINLTLQDKSSIFDFQAKTEFVPYFENKEPMFILNSYEIEKSLIHKLIKHYNLNINLPVISLKEKTYSFIIRENENVLNKLHQLFREFNYAFYFNEFGVFKVLKLNELINTSNEDSLRNKVLCFNTNKTPFNKIQRKFDNVKLSYSDTILKSKDTLFKEHKAVASRIGRVIPDSNKKDESKTEPFLVLAGKEVYPAGSDKEPEWINYGKGFLNSTLRFVKDTKLWSGYKKEEKDLSIIATMNQEIFDDNGKKSILLDDEISYNLVSRTNKYCLSFKNNSDEEKYIYWYDIYADTLYRNSKVDITIDEAKGFREFKEVFLEFVNDESNALSYYNFIQSYFEFGNISLSFSSPENFELGSLVTIEYENIGLKFKCLLISKSVDYIESIKNNNFTFYEYKAINFEQIKEYKVKKEKEISEEKQNHLSPLIDISDIYQKVKSFYTTNYLEDDYVFSLINTLFKTYRTKITLKENSIFMLNKNLEIDSVVKIELEKNISVFKPKLININIKGFQNIVDYTGISSAKLTSNIKKPKLNQKYTSKFKLD